MLMMLMIMMIVMIMMIMMGSRFLKSSLLLVAYSHSFANFARSSSRDGADSIYYAFVTSAGSWGRSGRSHMSQVPSAFLKFLKYPCPWNWRYNKVLTCYVGRTGESYR